ncbi:MAG: hypothetical protein J6W23_04450, partial [Victivallales bacterium]|nr:hypothetical protein [Victivallales bacterium]
SDSRRQDPSKMPFPVIPAWFCPLCLVVFLEIMEKTSLFYFSNEKKQAAVCFFSIIKIAFSAFPYYFTIKTVIIPHHYQQKEPP